MVDQRYVSDITMIGLRSIGLRSPLALRAKQWITAMRPETDNEIGEAFWQWVVDHYEWNQIGANHLLDTYFFCLTDTGHLVGTISLVRDDRDVGNKYNIPGAWIGGANVHHNHRNRGVLGASFAQLHLFTQTYVDAISSSIGMNLFTDNEYVKKLMQRYGFSFKKRLEIPFFNVSEDWYRRDYEPNQ